MKEKKHIHRNKRKEVPPQLENRKDLHIPGLWRQTLDGRNFILCDDGLDDKILIFGTPEIFSKMCELRGDSRGALGAAPPQPTLCPISSIK
ncbi:Uncharacterized protein FWK35_00022416 [Aphis craccivora]|uniref:Uncharacterized protein n=1 Tax=Aphis craccivora TaxID=307492 RepID=A0A6G0WM18_APHCR|nr:Uncharacterized protein FWK35_00022416 [Aphis craccivora]